MTKHSLQTQPVTAKGTLQTAWGIIEISDPYLDGAPRQHSIVLSILLSTEDDAPAQIRQAQSHSLFLQKQITGCQMLKACLPQMRRY